MSVVDTYHAYVYGTSFWYFLRGTMRIVNPVAVIGWFRPPVDSLLTPNDLELYTTQTDALTLLVLSALLLIMSDAVPLPAPLVGSALTPTGSTDTKKPYARAMVILTIMHHVTTAIGSYQHWKLLSHRTVAMEIGVWGNLGLTALGLAALWLGLGEGEKKVSVGGTPKRIRS